MVNKDVILDCVNAIKKVQKETLTFTALSREFVFSNIQLEMAIRCLYAGMDDIKDIPYDATAPEPVPQT